MSRFINMPTPRQELESVIVNAEQMRQIEERILASGMPIASLMEKVANLCVQYLENAYPFPKISKIGVLVGPGHNGGDGLVIARELYLQGYAVSIYCPFDKFKDLTTKHAQYAKNLSIPFYKTIDALESCQLIIDALFGFGLTRPLTENLKDTVNKVNLWQKPTVSIDIPSGLHTDTGEVLGSAIKATDSLCLGLWKQAYFQDNALEYLGKCTRLDFGISPADVWAILSKNTLIQTITPRLISRYLPFTRPLSTYKYQQGHLLLIAGSRRYMGASLLIGLGARASGIGMLSIAVPTALKYLVVSQLPEALIIDCPETETGAIAQLPTDLGQYDVIACGCGLTLDAEGIFDTVLNAPCPLILDADGLNLLAKTEKITFLKQRSAETILTPHLGEFKRLFPQITEPQNDRLQAVRQAAQESQAIVLLKGAKTAIAHPKGHIWVIHQSTPALARGGTGDVLTGLIGGLLVQASDIAMDLKVAIAATWHAEAGILASQERTEMGVDAHTLSQYLSRIPPRYDSHLPS